MSTTATEAVPMPRKIEVDFLYLDLTACSRCRATDATLEAALETVRPALDAVGATLEVRKTLVETEEQTCALGFASSPTIRVNGRDIAGEVPIDSPCAECGELCNCEGGVDSRVWDYRGELHTGAPTGLIVEAILGEIGGPVAGKSEATPEEKPSADVPENLKRFFAGSGTGAETVASSCCSAEEQAACCDPADKAGCCGEAAAEVPSSSSSCGCR